MPLVGEGVNIPIDGNADKLIAASNAAIKELDRLKNKVQANSREIEAAAKREQAALEKTAQKYSGSLAPGLEKAGNAVTGFISKNATLIAAFAAVGTAAVKSYQAFQDYAGSVRDVALASGSTAEEASRLIQVMDDFEITSQDVMVATKALTKNGMEPSLETMARLADEYVKIQDPMQRNEFLLKNLGKAGLQYANAMSQGGDALRAMGDEVNKSLILTDEQIKKAEMARLAVDSLADSWEGLKVSVGSAIGGFIASSAEGKKLQDQFEDLGLKQEWVGDRTTRTEVRFERFRNEMQRGAAMTEYYKDKYSIMTDSVIEDSAEMQQARANEIKDAISIQSANDKYNESQQEILDTITELQDKKKEMNASEIDEIAKINEKIEEQKQKYAEGAEAFGEAQGEKLVMLALEQIALQDGVAGYSEAEAEKARLLLDTAGVAEESAFRQALAFDQASQAIARGTLAAEELRDLLDMMSKHGWTIDVAVNVQQQVKMGQGAVAATGAAAAVGWQGGQWRGGDVGMGAGFSVPNFARGGAGGMGIVGDRQGGGWVDGISELVFGDFTVIPSAKSKKMLQSGMFGKVKGFAEGTDDGGGVANPIKPQPAKIVVRSKSKSRSGSASGDDGSDSVSVSAAVQAVEDTAMEMQGATQAVVQQIAAQNAQMTQQLINSNQQNQVILQQIASILTYENPNAVGRAVAYEVAKGS